MKNRQMQTDIALFDQVAGGASSRSTNYTAGFLNRPNRMKKVLKVALIASSVAAINLPSDVDAKEVHKNTAEIFIESAVDTSETVSSESNSKLLSRIRSLGEYSDNWDGNGAIPALEGVINASELFLAHLVSENNIREPHISLSGDGELCFYWHIGDFKLDLGFSEGGTYSYYATNGSNEYFGDDLNPEELLPGDVMELLTVA